MHKYLDLTGNVALVTGASSGIGAATAETLAELGARVAVGYHGNKAGAEAVRERIVAAGGTAIALAADVRRWAGESRAASGSAWTCPPRWARATPPPFPCPKRRDGR